MIRSINLPKTYGPRSQAWLRFCLILRRMIWSINLPKACGPRSQAWLRFRLILRKVIWSINLPKAYGSRSQAWLKFCLILRKIIWNINLPKACGLRIQAWLKFYLTFKQIRSVMNNVINENMAEKTFINNNIFVGYLHSRGVVQHFHLDLLNNMHLFQSPRWYDMTLPNWTLTFPKLGSLQYLKPFLIPSLQALMALTSCWHCTFTWACVDNTPIEPWHFLFVLQLNLNSSLIAHHCYSKWKNSSSVFRI